MTAPHAIWQALDGEDEPTLWRGDPDRPDVLLRRCDNPAVFTVLERIAHLAGKLDRLAATYRAAGNEDRATAYASATAGILTALAAGSDHGTGVRTMLARLAELEEPREHDHEWTRVLCEVNETCACGATRPAAAEDQAAQLDAAIEAGARVHFDRIQGQRRDEWRTNPATGRLWQWEDLTEHDQRAHRALVEPVVRAALEAIQ